MCGVCECVEKGREARASPGSQPGVRRPATLERPLPGRHPRGHRNLPGPSALQAFSKHSWTSPVTQTPSTPWRDTGDPTLQKPGLPGTHIILGSTARSPDNGPWLPAPPGHWGPCGRGFGPRDAGRCGKTRADTQRLSRATAGSRPKSYSSPGRKRSVPGHLPKGVHIEPETTTAGGPSLLHPAPQPQTNRTHPVEPPLHLAPRSPCVYKHIIWLHPFQILPPQFVKKRVTGRGFQVPQGASGHPRKTVRGRCQPPRLLLAPGLGSPSPC